MPRIVTQAALDSHTSELILNEVERLIALKGVNGFRLKDVSEPLGIQAPAIYKHYKNKDDVLVAVARRFIQGLSEQFLYDDLSDANESMGKALDQFVDFNINNPAYVRVALDDFATPQGGVEYVAIASGGTFKENFKSGCLSLMHKRLRALLKAGSEQGFFRAVDPLEVYRIVYSTVLLHLVFPEDTLLTAPPKAKAVKELKESTRDIVFHYLTPRDI